jgi:hypothetical protein
LIERVLHRLYQSPVLDRLDLFTYYDYRPSYAEVTLAHVAAAASAPLLRLVRGESPPRRA